MRMRFDIFSVSVIAMMSVFTVNAEVVSTELLDKRLGTEGNLHAVAHTGSYNDLTNKPTIPSVSGKEDVANKATDTYTTGSTTQYPSVKAAENIAKTAASNAASSKLNGNQGSTNVNKVMVVNSAGAITPSTIKSANIDAAAGITKGQLAADVQTSLGKADTALQKHQDISGKQDKATAVTHTANTAAGDSTHPVYVTATGVATKIDKVAAAAKADSATSATKATQDGNGKVIADTYATKTEMNSIKTTAEGKQDALTAGEYITITKDAESGETIIASTGPTYTLPAATAAKLGGVKQGSNITIASDGTISTHAPVTPGNGTITIKQGGASKGTFNMNQAGNTTIELTDTKYTLPVAGTALGGVKSGGNITVATDGTVTVNQAAKATTATSATSATKATQDASGNVITTTYATKTEMNAIKTAAEGKQDALTAGAYITITKGDDGKTTIASTGPTYTLPAATAAKLGGVKQGSNITIASDGTISTHAPVTPGNGTITIKQGGASKGSFTMNQAGNTTIELTDADTKYTLPVAGAALGGVKSGGNITVATDGTVTVNQAAKATTATSATSATKATQDASGNVITTTYATKTELGSKQDKLGYTAENSANKATDTYTTGSTTQYPSVKAAENIAKTAASNAASSKLNGNQGSTNVNKVMVVNSAGAITPSTIKSANIDAAAGITKGQLAADVQTSLGKADTALQSVSGGAAASGKVVTSVTKSGTAVSATMDYVKIPVGSATNPTSVASIWIQ